MITEEETARLAAVRALVAPQWRSHPADLPSVPALAYARGRNDMIDSIREALAQPDSTVQP